jgi:hypothetical protein
MVTLTVDPKDSSRLVLTETVTLYLDRILLETLGSEVESSIREQAIKDLRKNKSLRAAVQASATKRLLGMLGVEEAVGV